MCVIVSLHHRSANLCLYSLAVQLSKVLLYTAHLCSNLTVPKCFTFFATLLTVLNSQISRTALKKLMEVSVIKKQSVLLKAIMSTCIKKSGSDSTNSFGHLIHVTG